jgi:hypothetical protein
VVEGLQNLVRVQLELAYDLPEHVPLDLRKCQENVLGGKECVLPSARLVECPVDEALG